jgi:hypothetical protein
VRQCTLTALHPTVSAFRGLSAEVAEKRAENKLPFRLVAYSQCPSEDVQAPVQDEVVEVGLD